MDEKKVIAAWRKAGKELHIRVEAPFCVKEGKTAYHVPVYLPDFGGKKGAALLVAEMPEFKRDVKVEECVKRHGFFLSVMNYDVYRRFDRQSFIDTLDDLQYFGKPELKPEWYTGKPWTE